MDRYTSDEFVAEVVEEWFRKRAEEKYPDTEIQFSDAEPEAQTAALDAFEPVILATAAKVLNEVAPFRSDRAVIFERTDGEFGYRIIAPNHEIISASEGYTRKADAERGLRRLRPDITDIADENA